MILATVATTVSPAMSSEATQTRRLPKPGAWVAQLGCDGVYPQIAKVRDVHPGDDALDLIFYSGSGERIGRLSPAAGGPKTFEPFCSAVTWVQIEPPPFHEVASARWGWRHLLTPIPLDGETGPAPTASDEDADEHD